MAQLIFHDNTAGRQTFPLTGDRQTLGREDDCQIQVQGNGVSRHHAVIYKEGSNWYIEDLQSQNGVLLNGNRIQGPSLLFDQAELTLGEAALTFSLQEAPGQATTPAVDDSELVASIRRLGNLNARLLEQFGRVIVGQKQVAEQLLIAIAAGGHCLMIGLPGLAKTLMVSTLAKILDLDFKRVQFTPDLMPSDIIGTDVLEMDPATGHREFRFLRGPVFTNLLLADEINRTPPKTQAALLEAMQEKQVTASNHIFPLDPPFFVLATQNPLEQEGTYPLPEAQLDRFMFNILVDYPSEDEEQQIIMATTGGGAQQPEKVIAAAELLRLQELVRRLPVSQHVVNYATRLVRSTRPGAEKAPDFVKRHVHCGAGPRSAQCLVLGAKARAVLQGRVNVGCDDVRALAMPVLRHRLFTNFSADSEGVTTDDIIQKLLLTVSEDAQGGK